MEAGMAKVDLTAQRLRELLHYDPETGVFTRVASVCGVKAGSIAGHLTQHGYWKISLDGTTYYAHRLAWMWTHGSWPTDEIDHLNAIRADNRIANLRAVSRSINSQNMRSLRIDNTSGFMGVAWNRCMNRWVARIYIDGRCKAIGRFTTAEAAGAAYLDAKRKYHDGCTI
jgi:hypothetical protein